MSAERCVDDRRRRSLLFLNVVVGGSGGAKPPSGISVTRALPHLRTGKTLKTSSKRRTDLKIWPSKAKNLEEFDFDVRKSLAPRKSAENNEKPTKKSEFFSDEQKF